MELLAREIADEPTDNQIYQRARRVAEAQIDLVRVRRARHDFLSGHIDNPNYASLDAFDRAYKALLKFIRENGMEAPVAPDIIQLDRLVTPQGLQKVSAILADFKKELVSFDRYERRALSRWKFAIRALDYARRTNVQP